MKSNSLKGNCQKHRTKKQNESRVPTEEWSKETKQTNKNDKKEKKRKGKEDRMTEKYRRNRNIKKIENKLRKKKTK